ncbi:MAG: flavin reductase [Candidatus Thorarchaeota archaeon]
MEKEKADSWGPLPVVPVVLVGANVNGKPNYMTIGFVGGVEHRPMIIMISSTDHHTTKGILENGTFSINIPSSDQVIETDYCGVVSGRSIDKSEIFTTFYGELETAPMIKECPITYECKYLEKVELSMSRHTIYLGKVHQIYANEDLIVNKKIDMTKVNPIVQSGLEYKTLGESLGRGFKIGWTYKGAKIHRDPKLFVRGPKLFIRGPQYIKKEEFQVIGIEDIGKEENRDYLQITAKYEEIITRIPFTAVSYAFRINMPIKELSEKGEDRFILGTEVFRVTDIPEGAVLMTIPAQKYAIFTHIGNDANLLDSIQYIYREWFPNNKKYERVPLAPELWYYDGRYEFNSDDSELDVYIPIQEKSTT